LFPPSFFCRVSYLVVVSFFVGYCVLFLDCFSVPPSLSASFLSFIVGEYLLVSIHGLQGWIRYRNGKHFFLRPIEGFDWNSHLHIQETLSYYRVNENLPSTIELKVRHRPEVKSEIIGYLHPGDIIPCYAVIDNWLQIKYGKEDAAWIMYRTDNEMEQVNEFIKQKKEEEENRDTKATGAGKNTGKKGKKEASSNKDGTSNTEKKGNQMINPIRKRKIDYSSKPSVVSLGGFDESSDLAYDDNIITYEINGKAYKNDTLKNPSISSVKIHFFDFVRYGSVHQKTNLNHLLLIPYILQEKLLLKTELFYQNEMNDINPANTFQELILQTPFTVNQQMLFEIIVHEMTDYEIIEFLSEIDYLPSSLRENVGNRPPSPKKKKEPRRVFTGQRRRLTEEELAGNYDELEAAAAALAAKEEREREERENGGKKKKFSFLERSGSHKSLFSSSYDEEELLDYTEEERTHLSKQKEKISSYFTGGGMISMKDDIYNETAEQDDIFDDIDFL
jgi:hypothetical protein